MCTQGKVDEACHSLKLQTGPRTTSRNDVITPLWVPFRQCSISLNSLVLTYLRYLTVPSIRYQFVEGHRSTEYIGCQVRHSDGEAECSLALQPLASTLEFSPHAERCFISRLKTRLSVRTLVSLPDRHTVAVKLGKVTRPAPFGNDRHRLMACHLVSVLQIGSSRSSRAYGKYR